MRTTASGRPLRTRTGRSAVAAVVLVLAVLLGACSGDGSTGAARDAAAPHAAERGGDSDADSGADGGAGRSDGSAAAPGDADAGPADSVADGPRTIRRGGISLQVDDLAEAAARVRDQAAAAGGYVSDEAIGAAGDGYLDRVSFDRTSGAFQDQDARAALPSGPGEGRLVARVPTDRVQEAVNGFAAVGQELGRWSSETVVETALVDLESRVDTTTASVERVRALMGQATSLADVVALESELADREADLESLQAQLASLSGRAAMATVTVVLRTPDRAAQVEDQDGFLGGLRAGWEALGDSTVVLLTVLGAVLPFVVVLGLLAVPFVLWRRRVRRSPTRPAGGSGPSPGPSPGVS